MSVFCVLLRERIEDGCEVSGNRRIDRRLPLEAIRCLDSINNEGVSEKELNRYRLLWIKSRDKAYIAHTSDTLILDVIDYYDRHRSEGLYPEALYYGGRVYSDLGDLPTALEFFQKSFDEMPEDDAHLRFRMIVLNQKGRALHNLRLDSEAINYLEQYLLIDIPNEYYLNNRESILKAKLGGNVQFAYDPAERPKYDAVRYANEPDYKIVK